MPESLRECCRWIMTKDVANVHECSLKTAPIALYDLVQTIDVAMHSQGGFEEIATLDVSL